MPIVTFEGGFLPLGKKTALIARAGTGGRKHRRRRQDLDGSEGRASGKMNIVATSRKEVS